MASEYEKTQAYRRGLEGKSARSALSLKYPDRAEVAQNERGKRDKALIDAKKKGK